MAVCPDCQRESPAGALYCAFCGAGLAAAGDGGADALVGASLGGRYFLHAVIGRGGMGDVYRATDLALDRTVVVKVLRRTAAADPGAVRRFHREAQAAARLSHPNSVALLDSGETEAGTLFMVMELVPGATLAHLIATAWPLGEARAVGIGAQILAALAEAHGLGIIHRDLKPANVMVERREGSDRVKVLDFGIATLTEGDVEVRLTQQGTVFGTPAYMSPEQIRGEPLDPRSDLYAVGVILYEILAGRLPFESPTPMGLAARHLTDLPPPLAQARPGLSASPALEALIRAALAKDPAGRPASAEAFRTALLACAVADAPASPGATPLAPTAPLDSEAVKQIVRATTGPIPPARSLRGARGRRLPWAIAAAVVASGAAAWRLAAPGGTPSVNAAPTSLRAPLPPSPSASPSASASTPAPAPAPAAEPPPALDHTATPAAVSPRALAPSPAPPPPPSRPAEKPARPRSAAAPRDASTPARSVITAVRAELNSLPLPAPESGDGLLAIEASPWAEVTVDGQLLGETPREIQITAGKHRIRAVHPELGAKEGTAVVEPGKRKLWVAPLER